MIRHTPFPFLGKGEETRYRKVQAIAIGATQLFEDGHYDYFNPEFSEKSNIDFLR